MLKTLAALALLALAAACQPSARTLTPTQGEATIGNPDGKVVMVEFGAPTCPGCKAFHDQNWAKIKAAYVDTNKIKFIWRELPSHNPPVDTAIFGIARCVGGKGFFEVIDEAFARQVAIDTAARSPTGARPSLIDLGSKFGLSDKQVQACISDPKLIDRITEVEDMANKQGVQSTPTLFINDQKVEDESYEAISAQLDALLAAK